jgi:hypothetical protein
MRGEIKPEAKNLFIILRLAVNEIFGVPFVLLCVCMCMCVAGVESLFGDYFSRRLRTTLLLFVANKISSTGRQEKSGHANIGS